MYESLAWAVAAIAVCSFWAVSSWASNRRQEREAYYKAEAIKKVAEMQGNPPEAVLSMLREALTPPPPPPNPWSGNTGAQHRKEREAFYRSEVLKKFADSSGAGAEAAIALMREEERRAERRTRGGLRLGGLVLVAVGIGATTFLYAIVPDVPVYLAGLIPALIGIALLAYSYILVDRDVSKPRF